MNKFWTYQLNYASEPIGAAVLSLRGDIQTMQQANDYGAFDLIKAHWAFAEHRFLAERKKLRNRKSKVLKATSHEIWDNWFCLAREALDHGIEVDK